MLKSGEILHLGALTFDRDARLLKDEGGEPVGLRNQSSEVLARLADTPGEIVSKDDLIESAWPGVAVTDDSLTQCIADIRRALGEGGHEIVKTYPRRGYALLPTTPEAEPGARRRLSPIALGLAAVLLVAVLGVGWFMVEDGNPRNPLADDVRATIAVLPFTDTSQGDDRDFLSDAIPEGIIASLARNKVLRVIASNSSFKFRGTDTDARQIGEDLSAQYLLEGSQQKAGDRLVVTSRLIDAGTAETLWAHTYRQPLGELFSVQEQIIRTVADRVGDKIEQRPLPAADPDKVHALQLHSEALREIRRNHSAEGVRKIRAIADRIIEIDPDSAYGYSMKGWSYRHDAVFGWNGVDRDEALTKAEQLADKAIELAPDDAESHYLRARLHVERGETEKALIRFDRAVELNPSASNILNAYSSPLLYVGRTDEGIARIRQAMGIDPFHPGHFHWQMSWALWQKGQCQEAEMSMRKMDRIPDGAQRMLAATLACQGKTEEAKAALSIFLATSNQDNLKGERARLEPVWTAPGALDRWIEDLRLAGMPE